MQSSSIAKTSPFVRAAACVAVLTALAVAIPAGVASAASTRIDFDFTAGSFISILGGVIVTPPDGTMDTGVASLDVEATDITTFVPGGSAVLQQLALAGTVLKDVAGVADISGPYSGTQVGSLAGTINAALDAADFPLDLMLDLNVLFDCTGSGCGALGFPISEIGISALTLDTLPIFDIDIFGSARIEASVPISLDGVQGVLTLVGVEINRNFIPEPGTFATLAIGLALLASRRTRPGSRLAER